MHLLHSLLALLPLIPIAAAQTATCTNPKVRKDWRDLTKEEKANWIQAVNCLSKTPTDPNLKLRTPNGRSGTTPPYNKAGSLYDDMVYIHIDLSNDIHSTPYFFTWHRWYIQIYEDALIKYCNLTTPSPYWDWTKETNVQTSPIFTDVDPVSGMGGWGNPSADYSLTQGGFKDFTLSYPVKHKLRRQYTNQNTNSFSSSYINRAVSSYANNFTGFQDAIENFQGPHGPGHFIIGGDMAGGCPQGATAFRGGCSGPYWSANEPMFWLHHGMVDKVWFDWQAKSAANARAFGGRPIGGQQVGMSTLMPNDGLGRQATVGEIMNTTGGFLCYVYK